jgi:hypothetical protein
MVNNSQMSKYVKICPQLVHVQSFKHALLKTHITEEKSKYQIYMVSVEQNIVPRSISNGIN